MNLINYLITFVPEGFKFTIRNEGSRGIFQHHGGSQPHNNMGKGFKSFPPAGLLTSFYLYQFTLVPEVSDAQLERPLRNASSTNASMFILRLWKITMMDWLFSSLLQWVPLQLLIFWIRRQSSFFAPYNHLTHCRTKLKCVGTPTPKSRKTYLNFTTSWGIQKIIEFDYRTLEYPLQMTMTFLLA